MGGYLAGCLRTRWQAIHSDEVHFRDTANGLLAWAVSVLLTATFLSAAAVPMAGGTTASDQASSQRDEALRGWAQSADAYFVDRLFRSDHPATADDLSVRSEARPIFDRALLRDEAPAADTAHLAQLVAAKTGLSAIDAAKRVSDTITDARQAVDIARKATSHFWRC